MSSIRKNPPQPAPSRIAGTLKLRKAAAESDAGGEAGPDVDVGKNAVGKPAADQGVRARPQREGARAPRAGGRGEAAPQTKRERPARDGERAPRSAQTDEARAPVRRRREDGDAAAGKTARERRPATDEAPPRRREASVDRRDAHGSQPRRDAAPARAEGRRTERSDPRPFGGRGNVERGGERAPAPRSRPAPEGDRRGRPAEERAPHRAGADEARKPRPRQADADRAPRRREETPATVRPRPAPVARHGEGEAPTGIRLSKVMADRGICSRREADELIERGWVFVDGKRVSELGTRIDPDARVVLAPEAKRAQAQRVSILLHKPVGYVSGQPEPGYEPAVVLIGSDTQFDRDTAQRFHPSQLKGLAPAGRLDIDSTGLLVFTQDGRIARQLIGDDSKVEKEYLVRVEGQLAENGLALLNHGLWLDDKPLRPATVEWINDDQLRFVLREGRKRQIRRMCELVGLKVVGLKRVRIGRVKLGDLPLGQWRYLREDEAF